MNKLEASIQWLENKGDWFNAILVKETRQALKSRQFVATFMLLLLASWLTSLFYVVIQGDAINYGNSGRELFQIYLAVLLVAITVIVPFGAYRSLLNERDLNTYDALTITSLSPRQIVWGKLLSALLQVFIYYSAIAPFIAFTALLEGFEFVTVAFLLAMGFFVSLAYSVVALMMCTLANQRHWQAILSIVLLAGLVGMWFASLEISAEFLRRNRLDNPGVWWGIGLFLGIGLSYCWLFLQITTAQLTFETGNRSTGVRLTSSIQQLLIWGAFTAFAIYEKATVYRWLDDFMLVLGSFTIMHWLLIGLVAATEDNYLSRRIRRSLPRSSLRRLLLAPFLPGGARGFVYLLLNLAVLLGFCLLWFFLGSGTARNMDDALMAMIASILYLVFYVGLGSVFGNIARQFSGDIRPSHIRVLTVLFALAGIIAPVIAAASGAIRWNTYSLAFITNPVVTVAAIFDSRPEAGTALAVVAVAAGVMLLINIPTMSDGIREIVGPQPDTAKAKNRTAPAPQI